MPDTPTAPPPQQQQPLRLQLLRAAQLLLTDGSVLALSDRDAALLALLAIDGPLPRGRAAALLWPDADRDRARTSLRQRLFRLHQRAGREVVSGGAVLALAGGVQTDIAQWPTLQHDAAALPGDLLAGLDFNDELGRWVDAARQGWRSRRQATLADAAARHESEGHVAAALPFAQRLVADEPLLEHAQRRLMRLRYLRGDSAAALAVYEQLRSAMQRELGAAPGAETLALVQQVLAATPLAASALRPLPLLHTPRLIGRERAWAALHQAWALPAPVLLVGEAGIGKSRLLGDFIAAWPGTISLQARPGDSAAPYALVARLVRRLLAAGAVDASALPAGVREALAPVVVEPGGCRALGRARVEPAMGRRLGAKRRDTFRYHEHLQRRLRPIADSTRARPKARQPPSANELARARSGQ